MEKPISGQYNPLRAKKRIFPRLLPSDYPRNVPHDHDPPPSRFFFTMPLPQYSNKERKENKNRGKFAKMWLIYEIFDLLFINPTWFLFTPILMIPTIITLPLPGSGCLRTRKIVLEEFCSLSFSFLLADCSSLSHFSFIKSMRTSIFH